jgi:hypothetical protein
VSKSIRVRPAFKVNPDIAYNIEVEQWIYLEAML